MTYNMKKVHETKSRSTVLYQTTWLVEQTVRFNDLRILENAVVVANGRVSVKEDEAPKLLADRITGVQAYRPGELDRAAEKKQKLYLRLPDMTGETFERMKNLLEIFSGSTPVLLYLTEKKQTVRAPQSLWVQPVDLLLSELENLLGKGSVVLK